MGKRGARYRPPRCEHSVKPRPDGNEKSYSCRSNTARLIEEFLQLKSRTTRLDLTVLAPSCERCPFLVLSDFVYATRKSFTGHTSELVSMLLHFIETCAYTKTQSSEKLRRMVNFASVLHTKSLCTQLLLFTYFSGLLGVAVHKPALFFLAMHPYNAFLVCK